MAGMGLLVNSTCTNRRLIIDDVMRAEGRAYFGMIVRCDEIQVSTFLMHGNSVMRYLEF